MSEETKSVIEETMELVEEAQSKKVFNLADAIKGRAYPKKDVKIYLDDEAAMRLVEIQDELDYMPEADVADKLNAEAAVLKAQIEKTALTLTLRGVSQDIIETVLTQTNIRYGLKKGEDGTEVAGWMKDYITALVGANIESVTNADGETDSDVFNFDKTDDLRRNIPASEWGKLVEAMEKLTLAGGYFNQLTDAGFLQKS
jgi:hypothetical protein